MSSGGPCGAQPSAPSPFSLSYLFPTQPNNFTSFNNQQKIKLKRNRQRVDAGEPRNSYQQSKMINQYRDETSALPQNESIDHLSQFLPWLKNENTEQNMFKDDEEQDEQPTDLSNSHQPRDESDAEDLEKLDMESTSEDRVDDASPPAVCEPREGSDSAASADSATSSSSRRKSALPQKNSPVEVTQEEVDVQPTEAVAMVTADESRVDDREHQEVGKAPGDIDEVVLPTGEIVNGLSVLQQQLSTPPNKINDIMEAQKRIYAQFMENQRKMATNNQANDEKQRLQRELNKLAQALKQEIMQSLAASIDRAINEFASAELARMQAEAAAAAALAQQQQQQQQRPPMIFPPNPFHFPHASPFGVPQGGNGIFPNAFGPFNPLAAFGAALKRPMAFDDEGTRRKRNKVSDHRGRQEISTPNSARDTPQLSSTVAPSYFPPTMVGHPLFSGKFDEQRDGSPTNSDEMSDCGGYDNGSQSSTLTPMHLRKAKLMFFFTRYPNSSLLKSYFPDIRFNKNNTAQLVKWFSNFREFYYIQMEKFARQALAEGVRSREEIVITQESELFRQLNQHYNRNNHIEPPARLVLVVQETLREFFVAIKEGRDIEPSWKKAIYKVINRLDDPIPDFFKDPNFLDRLE